jgi:hypothetical protein
MVGFIVRLVGYALLLGLASRFAQSQWSSSGLESVAPLEHFHDVGVTGLLVAPVVLALAGIGRLRPLAVFVGAFLAGAAVTAPYVCARMANL